MIRLLIVLGLAASTAQASSVTNAYGRILSVSTVAPKVLAVAYQDGHVEHGRQVPYTPQTNDIIRAWSTHGSRFIERDGTLLGTVAGRDNDRLMTFDRVRADRLDPEMLTKPSAYRLSSRDDPMFQKPRTPADVWRKMRPADLARTGQWAFDAPVRHDLYLRFKAELSGGRTYSLQSQDPNLPEITFTYEPFSQVSEAIHLSRAGFHPMDPEKKAFLSAWLGDGEGHRYIRRLRFKLLNAENNRTVHTGDVELRLRASRPDGDAFSRNYNRADIYELDFSRFRDTGRFRIFIPGVGCSHEFPVSSNTWISAFQTAAQGFRHQRSGQALKTEDRAWPRAFHPDDGVQVHKSICTILDSGRGPDLSLSSPGSPCSPSRKHSPGPVDNAWGGYYEAGDWNRRIQHLSATRLLLELLELHPELFSRLPLLVPESGGALPDILDEALWNIDCFRRMQTRYGGIRGGIESASHPRFGETSWQESLPVFAYAPDPWSSYIYAGVAARATRCLTQAGADSAPLYLESALRAMLFAEDALVEAPSLAGEPALRDARNLAAAELYRLTGSTRWHDIFLSTTLFSTGPQRLSDQPHHDQADAAYVYAVTAWPSVREDIQHHASESIFADAAISTALSEQSGYGWTKRDMRQVLGAGVISVPQVVTIARAHALSKHPRYLAAVLRATQCSLGANPVNISYTTGIGDRFPQHPLCINARILGEKPPPGLTVFGPIDTGTHNRYWTFEVLEPFLYPGIGEWPTLEAWFDVYLFPAMCEYSIQDTLGPTAYAIGYLAANIR